jgi:hypothetical protein
MKDHEEAPSDKVESSAPTVLVKERNPSGFPGRFLLFLMGLMDKHPRTRISPDRPNWGNNMLVTSIFLKTSADRIVSN